MARVELKTIAISETEIYATIDGREYTYTLKSDSEFDNAYDLRDRVVAIQAHCPGKALAFLNRNAVGVREEVA